MEAKHRADQIVGDVTRRQTRQVGHRELPIPQIVPRPQRLGGGGGGGGAVARDTAAVTASEGGSAIPSAAQLFGRRLACLEHGLASKEAADQLGVRVDEARHQEYIRRLHRPHKRLQVLSTPAHPTTVDGVAGTRRAAPLHIVLVAAAATTVEVAERVLDPIGKRA